MNRCHFSKELDAYLDNQLAQDHRSQVEEHLKTCRACAEELSQLRLVSERLKAWEAPDLGPGFDSALQSEIVRQELEGGKVNMKKTAWVYLIPSGALAGVLLVLFVFHAGMRSGMQGLNREVSKGSVSRGYAAKPGTADKHDGRYETSYASFDDNLHNEAVTHYDQFVNRDRRAEINYRFSAGASSNSLVSKEALVANGDMYSAVGGADRSASKSWSELSGDGAAVIVIQPVLPATGEGEKIIRTGDVKLEVESGTETYKNIALVCQELGGYMASSTFDKDPQGRQAGSVTLRIPREKFLAALERLSGLGKVEYSTTYSRDVGQEYANLKAEMDTAMIVYDKMLKALEKRQVTIPDAVRLESELNPVRKRIEDLKNKIEYLNNTISFTTITVQFHEAAVSAKVLKETKNDIRQSLLASAINAVRFTARLIPVAIVLVILLVIAVGVSLLLKAWIVRLFKKTH
jgi:hypothetical protein